MTRTRRTVASALVVLLLGATGVAACSDNGSGSGGQAPQKEDAPDTGPQSGLNPAGGEPAPGTSPANG